MIQLLVGLVLGFILGAWWMSHEGLNHNDKRWWMP